MKDNENSRNPTVEELDEFLENDDTNSEIKTDEHNSKWFSTQLHNRLEEAGYRAGVTILKLREKEKTVTRAINIINCTNVEDPIFIDDVGTADGNGVDKLVIKLDSGEEYEAIGLYVCNKTYTRGTVDSYTIIW